MSSDSEGNGNRSPIAEDAVTSQVPWMAPNHKTSNQKTRVLLSKVERPSELSLALKKVQSINAMLPQKVSKRASRRSMNNFESVLSRDNSESA